MSTSDDNRRIVTESDRRVEFQKYERMMEDNFTPRSRLCRLYFVGEPKARRLTLNREGSLNR